MTAIGIVANEENAAVNETRSAENADALVLEKDADAPGLVSVRGLLRLQERNLRWATPAVGTGKEKELLLGTVEKEVETGIERGTAKGEAEAGIEKETGREERVRMAGKKALAG